MARTVRDILRSKNAEKLAENNRPKHRSKFLAGMLPEMPEEMPLESLEDVTVELSHDIVRLLTDSADDYMSYADYDRIRDLYMYD